MRPSEAVPYLLEVLEQVLPETSTESVYTEEARTLGLTAYEALVFSILRGASRPLDRSSFMVRIYSDRLNPPNDAVIDAYIFNLRKKLVGSRYSIQTVFGLGWQLIEQDGG